MIGGQDSGGAKVLGFGQQRGFYQVGGASRLRIESAKRATFRSKSASSAHGLAESGNRTRKVCRRGEIDSQRSEILTAHFPGNKSFRLAHIMNHPLVGSPGIIAEGENSVIHDHDRFYPGVLFISFEHPFGQENPR